MDLLPKLTFAGMSDYFGLAIGLAMGFAIFTTPMQQLENGLRKQ